MYPEIKLISKVKAQITKFSHKVSRSFKKPKGKFIHQMIYGIQAAKDVKLSNIARALNEDISLIKTECRLSRQISREDFSEQLNEEIIKDGAMKIRKDSVIAVDLSDISKSYANKMPYLAWVWDGSKKEKRRGYWILEIIGADIDGYELTPLYSELYSQKAQGFRSENFQIFKGIDRVINRIGTKGIYVIDRGGDRKVIFVGLLERSLRFVIRMLGKRLFIVEDGKKLKTKSIAYRYNCPYQVELCIRDKDDTLKKRKIHLGSVRVKFPFFNNQWFYLLIIKGKGKEPIVLLTTEEIKDEKDALRVLEIYLTRWRCEESFRFIKQGYNLEDIRLLTYEGLRNIVALVHAVFYFLSVELGRNLKLSILLKKIYEKAKRFFQIPRFKQYAINEGIHRLLFGKKFNTAPPKKSKFIQPALPFFSESF